MDNQTDRESLRAALQAMELSAVKALAESAGVNPETTRKFRDGHTIELGGSKLLALQRALAEKVAG